jgi:hypothetical protein
MSGKVPYLSNATPAFKHCQRTRTCGFTSTFEEAWLLMNQEYRHAGHTYNSRQATGRFRGFTIEAFVLSLSSQRKHGGHLQRVEGFDEHDLGTHTHVQLLLGYHLRQLERAQMTPQSYLNDRWYKQYQRRGDRSLMPCAARVDGDGENMFDAANFN